MKVLHSVPTLSILALIAAGASGRELRAQATPPAIPSIDFVKPVDEETEEPLDVVEASEGHATLQWEFVVEEEEGDASGDDEPATEIDLEEVDLKFELQHSRTPQFDDPHTVHEGVYMSQFVSGLEEGDNYYRVRVVGPDDATSPWSSSLNVQVKYPDRQMVVGLLIVGCIVFIILIVAVFAGHLRSRSS